MSGLISVPADLFCPGWLICLQSGNAGVGVHIVSHRVRRSSMVGFEFGIFLGREMTVKFKAVNSDGPG